VDPIGDITPEPTGYEKEKSLTRRALMNRAAAGWKKKKEFP
jgi:hypothetical protein